MRSIAVRLQPARVCEILSVDQAVEAIHAGEPALWLHLSSDSVDELREVLLGRLEFHSLAVEDALSPNERPSLMDWDDCVFCVVPSIRLEGTELKVTDIGFFLLPSALVTVAREPNAEVDRTFELYRSRGGAVATTPSAMLHAVADALVDGYYPVLDALEDRVDEVTDHVFEGRVDQARTIADLKRDLLMFRRQIVPVRDVLNSLLRRDITLVDESMRPYMQDVLDHVLRVSELIDINRETLASTFDIHLATISNNLNEVMRKMTVLSTVLMSAALIAGVYGMNFAHMPELGWQYGYPMAVGLMVAVCLGILAAFKAAKWL